MSCSLSSILHVSDFRETRARDAETLSSLEEGLQRRAEGTNGKHDPVRDECFEGNTHCDGSSSIWLIDVSLCSVVACKSIIPCPQCELCWSGSPTEVNSILSGSVNAAPLFAKLCPE